MSIFNIPSLTPDQANSVANSMSSAGYPFTMTQNGSGYSVDTNSDGSSFLSSAFASLLPNSATPAAPAADSPMMGNGTYPDGSPGGTAQTDTPFNNDFSAFFKEYGADAAAIVVGLLIVAGAVFKIV